MAARYFRVPPVCVFGSGASALAGEELRRLGVTRVLIVSDTAMSKLGVVAKLAEALTAAGISSSIFDKVDAEPTDQVVEAGLALLRQTQGQALVAVGGGSPIDAAKAMAVVAGNGGRIADYQGLGKISKPCLPLVAIPTTAGTGSEVTIFTIITDTARDVKMLIGSPFVMPAVALIDPDLTLSMPPKVTAATGLDALTHAIESYVSAKAQPLSEIQSLRAIELIGKNLRTAYTQGQNLEARTQMMLGSLMAGLAFSNASVALVHGMSRPVGAYFHVAHGVANAALLAPVTEFSLSGNPKRYADVARALGVETRGLDDLAAARAGLAALKSLIKDVGIPSLKGLGIEKKRLDQVVAQMAKDALASGSPANNPLVPSEEEIVKLYYEAYE